MYIKKQLYLVAKNIVGFNNLNNLDFCCYSCPLSSQIKSH